MTKSPELVIVDELANAIGAHGEAKLAMQRARAELDVAYMTYKSAAEAEFKAAGDVDDAKAKLSRAIKPVIEEPSESPLGDPPKFGQIFGG